jgi:hypothetical protein
MDKAKVRTASISAKADAKAITYLSQFAILSTLNPKL